MDSNPEFKFWRIFRRYCVLSRSLTREAGYLVNLAYITDENQILYKRVFISQGNLPDGNLESIRTYINLRNKVRIDLATKRSGLFLPRK